MTDPLTSALAAVVAEAAQSLADKLVAELRRQIAVSTRPPALLDRTALCRELGVSPATVDRLRAKGLPTVWVCAAPRFELCAALAWLREQRAGDGNVDATSCVACGSEDEARARCPKQPPSRPSER